MGLRQRAETKDWIDFRRREFLIRCCQGASAALVPVGLRGLAFPSILDPRNIPPQGDVDFHLHPHYRAPMPLCRRRRRGWTLLSLNHIRTGSPGFSPSGVPVCCTRHRTCGLSKKFFLLTFRRSLSARFYRGWWVR